MSERYVDGGGNIPVLSRKVADGMVLHPLSEIREWDEALAVLGIQDSTQTPAEAIRELHSEVDNLRSLLADRNDEIARLNRFINENTDAPASQLMQAQRVDEA